VYVLYGGWVSYILKKAHEGLRNYMYDILTTCILYYAYEGLLARSLGMKEEPKDCLLDKKIQLKDAQDMALQNKGGHCLQENPH
jgi:hypothetical protein